MIQCDIAETYLCIGSMAEDMDRIDAFTPFQIVSDLLQAILAAIEHDHFGAWCEAIDQLLLIGDLAIDEHHFLALIGGAGGRRGCQPVVVGGLGGGALLGVGSRGGLIRRRIGHGGGHGTVEQHARFEGKGQGRAARRCAGAVRGVLILVPEHGADPSDCIRPLVKEANLAGLCRCCQWPMRPI